MKSFIKSYFTFSSAERNGILVLLILIGIISGLPRFLEKPFENYEAEKKQFITEVNFFLASKKTLEKDFSKPKFQAKQTLHNSIELFHFDPNTASFQHFLKLGLSKRTAHTIVNYREKGGKFRTEKDLQKIYTLSKNDYKRLKPFIRIKNKFKKKQPTSAEQNFVKDSTFTTNFSHKKNNIIIELNSADSLDLIGISGIGPAFSKRIKKYRKLLGGFHSKSQLLEVYGLNQEKYEQISPYIRLDKTLIKKINVNHASITQLGKHPYIGFKKARRIINYRKQHGDFKTLQDLEKIKGIEKEDLSKMLLYLEID